MSDSFVFHFKQSLEEGLGSALTLVLYPIVTMFHLYINFVCKNFIGKESYQSRT